MRILIYGINYAPELTGIGKYTGEMAEWLAGKGHEVKVITAPPYYPYWRVRKPYRSWTYTREQIQGVDVHRCPLWVPTGLSGIPRVLHLLSFAIFSFPVFLRGMFDRPDIVLTIEPTFFSAALVALTTLFFRAKSWLHIQDFELDAAFTLAILPGGSFKQLVTGIEGWVMRRFDRVSSISTAMVQRLLSKRIPQSKTILLRNWTESMMTAPERVVSQLRASFDIPADARIILYSGNIGHKQGLYLLPDVAEAFKIIRADVYFLICGNL